MFGSSFFWAARRSGPSSLTPTSGESKLSTSFSVVSNGILAWVRTKSPLGLRLSLPVLSFLSWCQTLASLVISVPYLLVICVSSFSLSLIVFIEILFLIDIVGLGYLKVLVPPEKVLRWIEGKLNLLGRLPHYVSVDQKTYGRYGVLPSSSAAGSSGNQVPMSFLGTNQRLGA